MRVVSEFLIYRPLFRTPIVTETVTAVVAVLCPKVTTTKRNAAGAMAPKPAAKRKADDPPAEKPAGINGRWSRAGAGTQGHDG